MLIHLLADSPQVIPCHATLVFVAGPLATIHCPAGTSQFNGMAGKGYFEVIGTLNHDGTIAQMQTVFMGENFGGRHIARPTVSLVLFHSLPNPCVGQTPG